LDTCGRIQPLSLEQEEETTTKKTMRKKKGLLTEVPSLISSHDNRLWVKCGKVFWTKKDRYLQTEAEMRQKIIS